MSQVGCICAFVVAACWYLLPCSSCRLLASSACSCRRACHVKATAPALPTVSLLVSSKLLLPDVLPMISLFVCVPAGTPLGDPIELGAAAAVMADGASPSSPLALLAAKSWCGHSEPAAGVLGLAHIRLAISQRLVLPVLHLRTLNPHIQSTLSTYGSDGRKLMAARQLAPMAGAEVEAALMCGTSAFAFQGTNAHAIMSIHPSAVASPQATGQTAVTLPFEQKRFWVAPLVHPLLTSFKTQHAQHSAAVFEASLATAAAAYLWDHTVAGRALMPGAGTVLFFSSPELLARLHFRHDNRFGALSITNTFRELPMFTYGQVFHACVDAVGACLPNCLQRCTTGVLTNLFNNFFVCRHL